MYNPIIVLTKIGLRFARAMTVILLTFAAVAADDVVLMAGGDVSDWSYQKFGDIPETAYSGGDDFLRADSRDSASGYILKKTIDLNQTPYLYFRWRVNSVSANAGERTKAGDDFALRLYFVTQSGLKYHTLNLVYAQGADAGDAWDSPYVGWFSAIRQYSIARHHPGLIGQWQTTRLNLAEIWQEQLTADPIIGVVGIMTDSDNAAGSASADYSDIILTPLP